MDPAERGDRESATPPATAGEAEGPQGRRVGVEGPRRLDAQRVLLWVRRLTVLGCAIGLVYLWGRLDSFVLPEPCSPLVRLSPGTRLWVDRRPPRYAPGDVVFFAGPEGRVHLGEVRSVEAADAPDERLWIETDQPLCPGLDSRELGWIPRERLRGRLLFASGTW